VHDHHEHDQQDQECVERELDAIRRSDEQRITFVDLEQHRREDRGGGEQQEGNERAHSLRPRGAALRRVAALACRAQRSHGLETARQIGNVRAMGVPASCASVAETVCTFFTRVSK
jgi:hypothetical protein